MKILYSFARLLFFSYFWCHTFSVSRRTLDPDPVRILTDPARIRVGFLDLGHQWNVASDTKNKKYKKRGLANYLNLLNGILNIFYRSGPRAPYPDPKTGSSSLTLS